MAFFHSVLFLDIPLQFLLVCFLISVHIPPSRSWSSSCPYTLRLTAENCLSFLVSSTRLMRPVQSSRSYEGDNAHVFIQSLEFTVVSDSPVLCYIYIYSTIGPAKNFPLGCPQVLTDVFTEGPCFCSIQDDRSD
jgi:hypothetical protein